MDNWMKLAGIERLRGLFIEGEGGGEGAGGGGGEGAAPAGGTGGGDGSTASGAGTGTTPAVGTPVTEGGGAPASTQTVSSTLVDDKGKPVRELGEENSAYLSRFREWKTKQPAEGAEPAAKTPEQVAAEAETAKAKPAETAKTPEQAAAEQKAATDAKAAEVKAQTDTTPVDDFYEDLAPIPTEELAKAIKEHPAETEAFLKATGLTQDQLFANSRLAGKAGDFMKEFSTIESARYAKVGAEAFQTIQDAVTEIKPGDLGSTRTLINDVLLPMTYIRDDNGQVMVDKNTGLPQTDGTMFALLDNVEKVRTDFRVQQLDKATDEKTIASAMTGLESVFDALIKVAKKIGGDRGEQLQLSAELLKGCGKAGSPSGDGENLSEDQKARLAEADRVKAEASERQRELDQREAAEGDRKIETFKEEVGKESSTEMRKLINGMIDRTSLKDDKFLRETVVGKIEAALVRNMVSDSLYKSQRDGITINGPTPKTRAAWVALNVREAKARLRTVAEPIFTEAGAKKLAKGQERQTTITAQEKASQSETKGGTTTSVPKATPSDPHELLAQARQNLRDRGEEISTESLLAERRKLLAKVPA